MLVFDKFYTDTEYYSFKQTNDKLVKAQMACLDSGSDFFNSKLKSNIKSNPNFNYNSNSNYIPISNTVAGMANIFNRNSNNNNNNNNVTNYQTNTEISSRGKWTP